MTYERNRERNGQPVERDVIETIRTSIIGSDEVVVGPFGPRPVVYADYTASGRALTFIERYIADVVLRFYANTHTESSGTGLQTTRFREQARTLIGDAVGADGDHAVLFCGTGATGAIDKLVSVLGLRIPSNLEARFQLDGHIPATDRPVVFIGPYEHHSNELPWRESIADVIAIGEDAAGHIDLRELESRLERHRGRSLLIGSFSAASNVTGILTDTAAVSTLLHDYGALAFWDYAAAAPYVPISMGTPEDGPAYLDAVFISPHKFIGGPGTPGLLVARRELFDNRVPAIPGGGTVSYVSSTKHDYVTDIEMREEGGTPDIIGAIRAGLAFQLKSAVGAEKIVRRERRLIDRARAAWEAVPNLKILGNLESDRLSILSFIIAHPGDRTPELDGGDGGSYLHHNYIVAVLNDMFGIQARGGCSCAGPYGHRLLGVDKGRSELIEQEVNRGREGIKPGWVRVNFNYFIEDETADYIIGAVELIARHGYRLLPYYRFEPASGLWSHRDGAGLAPLSLNDISYEDGTMRYRARRAPDSSGSLSDHLRRAKELIEELSVGPPPSLAPPETSTAFESLRWFPYPGDR